MSNGFIQYGTCSIDNPKNWCATFARDEKYLRKLEGKELRLTVFVPKSLERKIVNLHDWVSLVYVDYPEYNFAIYHNYINKDKSPAEDVIGIRCDIHATVIVGQGINIRIGPNGKKAQLKAMGNVVLGDDVYVGPLTLIERGELDWTIIGNGVKIDGRVTIGHNSVIGEDTVVATGAVIGGSVVIGKNCWIGLNATIRNGVNLCDGVIIGAGSVVVRDITVAGIYAGVPAQFLKEPRKDWNF